MENKNLIALLGYQYIPKQGTLQDLRAIVEEQAGDARRLDSAVCDRFLWIAVSAYNYGMIAGVRKERKRRHTY